MKKFEDYKRTEKASIIRKGGIEKTNLEQSFKTWIREKWNSFPQDVQHILNTSDPMLDIFGYCNTVEEIIEFAKEVEEDEEN